MADIREIFKGEAILEKTTNEGVVKRLIEGATLIASPDSVRDGLLVGAGDYDYEYSVDSEDVTILADGTIEFEALGAKYRIRKVEESDDLSNLNPDETGEEEELETDE